MSPRRDTGVIGARVDGVLDTRHWIGGERVASADTFTTGSPINGSALAAIARGGAAEAAAPVASAHSVFPGWAAAPRQDLDRAVDLTVEQYDNAGQVCLAGPGLLVESWSAHDSSGPFIVRAAALRQGEPLAATIDIGPAIPPEHVARNDGSVQRTLASAVSAVIGDVSDPEVGGLRHRPTLLTDAAPDAEIVTEEVFGPVPTLQTFDTEEEALQLVNGTRFGHAGAPATGAPDPAARVGEKLVADTGRNNCFFVRDPQAPFGWSRQSDVGREGDTGSLYFYGDIKNTVTVQKGGHARG
ncbi:aldehyde dehydrogenase family protein [Streptomyces sp. NPDC016566]|uniref:aldehyde dehydrogenase family protein n=1 Tax=Streptomyces sp. NPDC016566 TaxID=3364967 RepID=UPI0036FCA521